LFALSQLARPPACNASASIDVLASDVVATKGLTANFVPFSCVPNGTKLAVSPFVATASDASTSMLALQAGGRAS